MRYVIIRAGQILHYLTLLLGTGLVLAFLRSLFNWDLSPWWFWLLGIAVFCVLEFIAQGMIILPMKPPPEDPAALFREYNSFVSKIEMKMGFPMGKLGRIKEIPNDGVAGCLRTPRGGSSKQFVIEAGYGKWKVRNMTAREYASLQGTDNSLPINVPYNKALYGFGDAVCVPVMEWIAKHHLNQLISETPRTYQDSGTCSTEQDSDFHAYP